MTFYSGRPGSLYLDLKRIMTDSPWKKQLLQMRQKGAPDIVLMNVYMEYKNSGTLTDRELEKMDRLLRKDPPSGEDVSSLAKMIRNKCLITAYNCSLADPDNPVSKTLRENGVLVTFANIDESYTYVRKYDKDTEKIRFITFESLRAQADSLKTRAVLAWREGDDTLNGRRSLYYDGASGMFGAGAVITHGTRQQKERFEAYGEGVKIRI